MAGFEDCHEKFPQEFGLSSRKGGGSLTGYSGKFRILERMLGTMRANTQVLTCSPI